jgi:hypothetical protein
VISHFFWYVQRFCKFQISQKSLSTKSNTLAIIFRKKPKPYFNNFGLGEQEAHLSRVVHLKLLKYMWFIMFFWYVQRFCKFQISQKSLSTKSNTLASIFRNNPKPYFNNFGLGEQEVHLSRVVHLKLLKYMWFLMCSDIFGRICKFQISQKSLNTKSDTLASIFRKSPKPSFNNFGLGEQEAHLSRVVHLKLLKYMWFLVYCSIFRSFYGVLRGSLSSIFG